MPDAKVEKYKWVIPAVFGFIVVYRAQTASLDVKGFIIFSLVHFCLTVAISNALKTLHSDIFQESYILFSNELFFLVTKFLTTIILRYILKAVMYL